MWKVVGHVVGGRQAQCAVVGRCKVLPDVQQLHVRQPSTVLCKTRGCLCSFRLLTMGGVSPETCSASFKIRNNKILIHCCIFFDFSVRTVLQYTDPQTSSPGKSVLHSCHLLTTGYFGPFPVGTVARG